MVVLSRDIKVWVEVDGVEAKEYGVREEVIDGVATVTCFIEAAEEKEFVLCYQNLPVLPECSTRSIAYIDGRLVTSFSKCVPDICSHQHTTYIRGFPEKRTGTEESIRSFVFGKMPTTHIGSPKDMPEEALTGTCTIRLDIQIKKRIGGLDHRPAEEISFTVPDQTQIHEDSKPALWGLSTKAGGVKKQLAGFICFCQKEQASTMSQSVIFKYRSHGNLVAEGLKEASMSRREVESTNHQEYDDGVQIDVHRTERTASRRRARREVTSTRNTRMKREVAMKTETNIKEEEGSSQPARLTLDLTADEDNYKVIRAKREMIVIKDETDDED